MFLRRLSLIPTGLGIRSTGKTVEEKVGPSDFFSLYGPFFYKKGVLLKKANLHLFFFKKIHGIIDTACFFLFFFKKRSAPHCITSFSSVAHPLCPLQYKDRGQQEFALARQVTCCYGSLIEKELLFCSSYE